MIHFHFDLRHLPDHSGMHVTVNHRVIDLAEHSFASRRNEGSLHKALQHLEETIHLRFTHFAGIDRAALSENAISWIKMCRKSPAGIPLDTPILVAQYIPENHLRAFYRRQFRTLREAEPIPASGRPQIRRLPMLYSYKLHEWGLFELPQDEDEAIDLLLSTQAFIDTRETAVSLVAHHPALATLQPSTAALLRHHILPSPKANPRQSSDMQALVNAITANGESWSPVIRCIAPNGKEMVAEYELKDEFGTAFELGSQLFTYGLADSVGNVLAAPIAGALKTAADDPELRNKIWTPAVGKTVKVTEREHPSTEIAPMLSAGTPVFKWTVTEQTDHYGVSVKPSSVRIDGDQFSIDCSNSYARTLFAGYRLKIKKDFEDIEELYSVNATNDVMGIPIPTLPTTLTFGLNGASELELLLGSLGVGDWTEPVSSKGANLTALWQYGVPSIFMVAGKLLTSTATFKTILDDPELVKKVIIVFSSIGVIGGTVDYGDNGSFKTLSKFANITFGIILSEGLEKLGNWVLKQVGAGEMASAMGPVGWALRAAAISVDFVRMGVTTGEVLSSPATVRIRVSRAIDVSLTLKPDPKHGEAGNPATAVWPSVASRYLVTFQYVDGTNRQLSGPLEATTSGKPLHLLFSDVPAGGKFQIIAGVYSNAGWLAGTWQSGWRDSIPNHDTILALGEFTIVENLVPLSPDTHYEYKEEIQFAGDRYQWAVDTPSQATIHELNGGDKGTLSELVSISLNNSAYQVGFAWKASGQNLYEGRMSESRTNKQLYSVQNLSVLQEPGGRLISTEIGFTHPVRTAYAPSTLLRDHIDQHNFVLDPSGHLRQVLLSANKTSFGFELEQLSWGRFRLDNVDALAVHPGNLVIACSFDPSTMMILTLPGQGCLDADAPEAMPVSGEGVRQGLMRGPKAVAVASDGTILVLESKNSRVQAFDRKGNPVPCFTSDKVFKELDTATIADDLDAGRIPPAFHQCLADSGTTWCAQIDGYLAGTLNGGSLGANHEVIIALALEGVHISHDPKQMDNCRVSPVLSVINDKKNQWTLADPRGQFYSLISKDSDLEDGHIDVYELPANCEVEVQTPQKQWLITDKYLGMTWKLTPSLAQPGKTTVKQALSHFSIGRFADTATYLDMAAEAAGHVYISYYRNDGSKATDYCLDVYTPQGKLLIQSASHQRKGQNLLAGKFAVDIWRNLYALSYAPMPGLKGKVQPGIMHWTPTPPRFSLSLGAQEDLNEGNLGAVAKDFREKGVALSADFFIRVIDRDGYWEVKDNDVTYHLYRSGDGIEVYLIGATTKEE